MTINLLKRALLFVIFCLAQVLVLNHIHLFDCATPLLYVYFVLIFPRNYKRWAILIWCFCMGLVMDTFANTPGVGAASMTFVGLLQPFLLKLFIHEDSADDLKPSFRSMGSASFTRYVVFLVLIYNIVFYVMEAFNFFNWLQIVECIGGSTVLTVLLILAIESVRKK
jgi:rod shape-determining protein MreD